LNLAVSENTNANLSVSLDLLQESGIAALALRLRRVDSCSVNRLENRAAVRLLREARHFYARGSPHQTPNV